jgi:hypothetical protein
MNLPEADRNVMRPVQRAALALQTLKFLWVATDCTLKGTSFNSVRFMKGHLIKVKVKFTLEQTTKAQRGIRGTYLLFL